MKDELAFVQEARKVTLDLLKPGTPCRDIWQAFNVFMRKNGRPEEARLYCHGQGYDLVERPRVRADEPMTIEKDMNIVVHPTYLHGGWVNWLCDNYFITGNGPTEAQGAAGEFMDGAVRFITSGAILSGKVTLMGPERRLRAA